MKLLWECQNCHRQWIVNLPDDVNENVVAAYKNNDYCDGCFLKQDSISIEDLAAIIEGE